MTGFGKLTRNLLRWRNLRWLPVTAIVPAVLWACNSHPFEQPLPAPEAQTNKIYELNPLRQLDLHLRDRQLQLDGAGAGEHQAQLSRLHAGTGEHQGRPAGHPHRRHLQQLRSRARHARARVPGLRRPRRFPGAPQLRARPGPNGAFLKVDGKGNKNFTGDLPKVFSCMASLGTMGCGYEHQLQSLRAALAASDPSSTFSPQNRGFIRRDAFLGIVILSDEDDCSGEPGANYYQEPVPGQAGSFRCASLGHVCGGQPVQPSRTSAPPSAPANPMSAPRTRPTPA